ncbi:hypothetical protein GQX74_012766 [Glossina fuscipes]|nr:hypothetical protein GQX74_012766 [Glossina fuscipes]
MIFVVNSFATLARVKLPSLQAGFFKPVSLVLEPILKEPGDIAFTWLEIYRTKNALLQQFDLQMNNSSTAVTTSGGGSGAVTPGIGGSSVSGHHNCPSGFDESEEECGTARKLLELPGGVFAALGCIAAAVTACLIFCIFGLLRKRKKTVLQKSIINGGSTLKKDFKKESLFIDPAS